MSLSICSASQAPRFDAVFGAQLRVKNVCKDTYDQRMHQMYIQLQRETRSNYSFGETSKWGLGLGDPQGDPRGILRGSRLKTGDPGLGHPIKTRGSGETTLRFYNIKKVYGRLKVASFRAGQKVIWFLAGEMLSRILPCLRVC